MVESIDDTGRSRLTTSSETERFRAKSVRNKSPVYQRKHRNRDITSSPCRKVNVSVVMLHRKRSSGKFRLHSVYVLTLPNLDTANTSKTKRLLPPTTPSKCLPSVRRSVSCWGRLRQFVAAAGKQPALDTPRLITFQPGPKIRWPIGRGAPVGDRADLLLIAASASELPQLEERTARLSSPSSAVERRWRRVLQSSGAPVPRCTR